MSEFLYAEPRPDLLETFENPHPARDYEITHVAPEFTSVCPKTGHPDFGTLTLRYVPTVRCVELKSLKLYMWAFREEGGFHEKLTNDILDDLVALTEPRFMRLTGNWNVRGGIYTKVIVEHRQPGWEPQPRVELP